MTKEILILGGTGILGHAICKTLLEEGHVVYVFNRGNNSHRLHPGSIWIQGDRRNSSDIRKLEDIEVHVIIDTMGWCHETLPQIFELLGGRIEKYIFISSVSVYGGSLTKVYHEEEDIHHMPVSVHQSLCEEKRACEKVCELYYHQGIPVTSLRLSFLLGYPGIMNREKRLIRDLLGNKTIYIPDGVGTQLQFIHIRDVIAICRDMINGSEKHYQNYYCCNVTSKYAWTMEEWVMTWAAYFNVTANMAYRTFHASNKHDFIYSPNNIVVSNERINMLNRHISEFSYEWIHELM